MIRHPFSKTALLFSLLLVLGANGRAASADVILVTAAKNPIDELDTREVQSLYKGRLTSINGKPLKPLNAAPGSIERKEFLNQMMKLNELDYTGYWHVRRYSGQGTPPLEVASQIVWSAVSAKAQIRRLGMASLSLSSRLRPLASS